MTKPRFKESVNAGVFADPCHFVDADGKRCNLPYERRAKDDPRMSRLVDHGEHTYQPMDLRQVAPRPGMYAPFDRETMWTLSARHERMAGREAMEEVKRREADAALESRLLDELVIAVNAREESHETVEFYADEEES